MKATSHHVRETKDNNRYLQRKIVKTNGGLREFLN